MPLRYALELVCDYLGAGEAYMGKDFTFEKEYEWWCDKKSKPIAMHPQTIKFVETILGELARTGDASILEMRNAEKIYEDAKRSTLAKDLPHR